MMVDRGGSVNPSRENMRCRRAAMRDGDHWRNQMHSLATRRRSGITGQQKWGIYLRKRQQMLFSAPHRYHVSVSVLF
jgi:hypothetical protein